MPKVFSQPTTETNRRFIPFGTMVADPPWPYNNSNAAGIGVDKHYPTLSIAAICALPAFKLCAARSHLYLWVTNSFMEQGHQVARAWGFDVKTILTWGKICKGEVLKPRYGMGRWFRNDTEHVLFGVRGQLPLLGRSARSNLIFSRSLGHSVKLDWFYFMCERCSPGPRLELFARRKREGWSCWGNEVESDVRIEGA